MAKFTRIAHLSLMYIRLRSTDSLHKKFCRITSYDAAAGGLLGSLCLGLLAQLCRHAHGQLLSEWAVNETVKRRGAEGPAAGCGLALIFALPPARQRAALARRRRPAFPTRAGAGNGA